MPNIFKKIKVDSYTVYFLLSLVVGLVPVLWFRGLPIAGEEYYALNYAKWGQHFSSSWFSSVNWGEYSPLSSFKFQGWVFNFFQLVGFSRYFGLLLWYTIISVLTIGFFYILLIKVFEKKYSAFLYFIVSVYYLLNPFLLNISVTLSPPKILFLFLPIVFILFVNWYRKGGVNFNDIVVVNIVLLLASPIFVNIPLGLVLVGTTLLNLFAVFITKKTGWIHSLRMLALFGVLYLSLNVWWLVPTLSKQMGQSADVQKEASTFVTVDKTSTLDILSLFGSWAFREKIFNTEYFYFPFNQRYDSFPGSYVRFIPFPLIIVALYALYKNSYKEKNTLIYYFFFIYILFSFLSKGTAEPFGFVYRILYDYFPFFWMYREPYAKFAPLAVLSTSVLMVYGLGYLYNKYHKLLPSIYFRSAAVIAILSLVYYAWPFLNGSVIWNVNQNTTRSYHIKVPQGWNQLEKDWTPGTGYYYQFPSTDIYDSYNWESGYNGNPYLMLTDAKLINPERGYSASENTERKFITTYLYNLIINSPQKLVEVASRYNLEGIILQKDTVYNNYKYAFSVIQKRYDGLLGFSNDSANIYDLNQQSPSLIDILPGAGLLNLKPEDMSYYHLVRNVTDTSNLIKITKDNSDYHGISPQRGSNNFDVTYEIPKDLSGQNIYIYGNFENISTVKTDNRDYPFTDYGNNFISINPAELPGCCSKIVVTTKNGILSGGSAPLLWSTLPIFSPDLKKAQKVPNDILNINTDNVFIAQMPFFDPSRVNHIQFALKGNYNYPVGVSLVQVDPETLSTRYFANYQVQDISKPLTIVYDGVVNPLTQIFDSPVYYLAVYGMKLTDANQQGVSYPKDIAYTTGPITVIQERIPYLFVLPANSVFKGNVITPEYNKLSDSVTVVRLPENLEDNSYLQFKNSHNVQWKYIGISEQNYQKYKSLGMNVFDLWNIYKESENGKSPVNIEYYSNAWKINKSDSGGYAAIIFVPSILQDITFIITQTILLGILLYYIFKVTRKLIKKV